MSHKCSESRNQCSNANPSHGHTGNTVGRETTVTRTVHGSSAIFNCGCPRVLCVVLPFHSGRIGGPSLLLSKGGYIGVSFSWGNEDSLKRGRPSRLFSRT